MPERELLVRILGDDRDLQRALGSTNRRLEQIDNRTAAFGRNVGRAFAAAGIAVGATALIDALGDSVDAASALNEELSKSQQVFGDSSQAIEAWSKTTAQSFGISQRAALEATGVFGNLFNVVDVAPDQAAAMSQALVELAADLASFNNADPSDVLNAIRSGLIGEAEPLRRYGVLLSEARVQQLAVATTGKANVKELTNQEKALARYNIILQDTSAAQGDFARTSDGLANQGRILDAQLADLSAELGQNLVPVLIAATKAANGLFDAFEFLGTGLSFDASNQDLDELRDNLARVRAEMVGVVGDSDLMVRAIGNALTKINQFQQASTPRPDDRAGIRGPGAVAITNAQIDARSAERAAAEARQAQRRRQKAFDEFIKGQGLKLDNAALDEDLANDLAVLRVIESAILRRIAREGRTFKLAEQLTAVRQEIARTVEQQASQAKQAGEDAYNATIDAINLDLDVARASESLQDDQRALRALESAIFQRISTEGRTTDLMRQLFQVRQEQKDVAQRLADQQRERRRGRQFEALGLTTEGNEPAPSVSALRRRRNTLEEQIKGTTLDTKQNRAILENAAKVLSGQFGAVGRDVRSAIERMFDEIAAGLEGGDKKVSGPLTKTSGLNTKKILAGLGLSPEEVNALRGRLSGFNTSGQELAGFVSGSPSRISGFPGMGDFGPIIVENEVTVVVGGQKVSAVVTKEQQKQKRRNPQQKRGPNRNR